MSDTGADKVRAAVPSLVVAFAVFAVYSAFSIQQWRVFAIRSWDLGIFSELAQSYAAFRAPIVNIKGPDYNLLGDHFHPILVLLGPVWSVFPNPLALLIVQNLLFALSTYVITRLARQAIGPRTGLLVGLAYGLSWGLQGAVDAQFHEVAFAVPLLAFSAEALYYKRFRAAALWAAPLVFVKEDLGFTVIAIAIVVFIQGGRITGLALAGWGMLWFVIGVAIVIPLLNGEGVWQYGAGFAGQASAPLDWLAELFALQKFETLLWLALAGAAIAFRSPIIIIIVPTLLWRFLSSNSGYWGHTWHYSAVLMPVLFVAAIDGISRARFAPPQWMRQYSAVAPAVAVTVALLLFPQAPVGAILNPTFWAPSDRAAASEGALDAVAAGSKIESDISLMSYLVPRGDVYWIGNANPTPDYIVVDVIAGGLPADWADVLDVARALHPEHDYAVVFDRDGYQVAELLP